MLFNYSFRVVKLTENLMSKFTGKKFLTNFNEKTIRTRIKGIDEIFRI